MRVNRQTLLKIVDDTVQQRVKESRSILAVYLQGSFALEMDPFLGESTDIDLVFIHEYDVALPREIVALTEDVTFDILHQSRMMYRSPRDLRSDPWLGPAVYNFKILHDPRHFLDFIQAGLRDQYFRPPNVLARARSFAASARRRWTGLLSAGGGSPESALQYFEAIGETANAIASLDGSPLPERRLLAYFFARCQAMGQPGLYTRVLELLGAGEMDADDLKNWLSSWEQAFTAATAAPPEWGLQPARRRYFQSAFNAQAGSARPTDALWALLATWTRLASCLPDGHPARAAWEVAMTQISLLGPGLADRVHALDGHLDWTEETLDAWGKARGADEF